MTNIEIIKGSFTDVSKAWNRPIDCLLIDGSHDYESVKNDFNNWSKFVKSNGIILFHDIEVKAFGVRKLYDEIDGYYKVEFEHSYGLGVLTKDKDLYYTINNISNILKRMLV